MVNREMKRHSTYRKDEALINVPLADIRVEIWALYESQEKLVDNLQMRPCKLQDWFVLFGIESIASRVDLGRNGPEEICSKLSYQLRSQEHGRSSRSGLTI
jgi:hypothetical protein